jgi:Ca2+-binding RTX toxin-like protein
MPFRKAVIDTGSATATPSLIASQGTGDYDVPGQGGVNEWQQNIFGEPWFATADVEFVGGKASIPIRIIDDAEADGNKTIEWTISDSAAFGFSQETYIFNEDDANNENNGVVSVDLSLNSTIKTATIIIEDSTTDFNPITGNAANNSLYGGDGNDIVYAKAGNDNVDGRKGNDHLYGEAGNDTLLGKLGNDYLNAGGGKDKLYGEAGNDVLEGLTGNDSIYGGTGNDILLGYEDNDYLNGGNGNDIIKGQAGNDTFIGGSGNDRLTGRAGADTFVFYSPSDGIDTIRDFNRSDSDKIQVSASGFGIGQGQYDKFRYDSSTGALFFEETQLARLQPDLGFVPSLDITIF